MHTLPFLVVHGGWVWPIVGVAVMALSGWAMRRWQRRRHTTAPAMLRTRRHAIMVQGAPIFVALLAGLLYFVAVRDLGHRLVDDGDIDDAVALKRWRGGVTSASGLAIAAATPNRRAALERLYEELEPTAIHGDLAELQIDLLRLMDRPCELIVAHRLILSHHQAALDEAGRCSETAMLLRLVRHAHLGLGQLDQAATALEREVAVEGGRSWTRDDLVLLAMARRWPTLERAARELAAEVRARPRDEPSAASEPVLPGHVGALLEQVEEEPPLPSALADALECVALAARYRGGDASALDDLRARPFAGGAGACRLLAADATGALDDLQVLSAYPITGADLAAGAGELPSLGDARALPARIARACDAPGSDAASDAPPVRFEYPESPEGSEIPESWRADSGPGKLHDLRELVLRTHAPGAEYLYVVRPTSMPVFAVLAPAPSDALRGMHVRAARAQVPRRTQHVYIAESLDAGLAFVAVDLSEAGEHEQAVAYLAVAADVRASLPLSGFRDSCMYDLQRFGELAMVVLVRAGRVDEAVEVYDQVQAKLVAAGTLGYQNPDFATRFMRIARGDVEGLLALYSYGGDAIGPMLEQLAGGDASGLEAMSTAQLTRLRHAGLLIAARRVQRGRQPLLDLLRNYPLFELEPDMATWFQIHALHLQLAESLAEHEVAATLRARAHAFFDPMTAADSSLLVAMIGSLP